MGYARFIIERRIKFISSSDPEITATDSEVNRDAETFDNHHFKSQVKARVPLPEAGALAVGRTR